VCCDKIEQKSSCGDIEVVAVKHIREEVSLCAMHAICVNRL